MEKHRLRHKSNAYYYKNYTEGDDGFLQHNDCYETHGGSMQQIVYG